MRFFYQAAFLPKIGESITGFDAIDFQLEDNGFFDVYKYNLV